MNSVVKQMFVVLILVGSLAGLVLAGSYKITKPMIAQHKLEELEQSIFEVLPDAKRYEQIDSDAIRVYKGLRDTHNIAGYAFVATGPGFQGPIEMMVGIDASLQKLLGMRVLAQSETPGLGAKIMYESFQGQFVNLTPNWLDTMRGGSAPDDAGKRKSAQATENPEYIGYVKNVTPDKPNDIQAITGATISSAAVVTIINQHLSTLQEVVGNEIQ
ncbi:hypothetical protein CSB45_07745 [candidate division KSB3 bacterium]|uniref:Ion-translocating oxidoreductase complex subunit G n=1 Tax=candidate division KSB3 bacterium TaxID=2044937 RepID=A0A2G6E5N8_9BACT|nr:MAG: hypothetical protein CSB45_07745 [candidate division KSB3 bacterium]PIE29924.1 MAG: hypothetical protein CSA57_06445 [candidate division KSB3 bacterium]